MRPSTSSARWDALAMLLSAGCILHCLGLPIAAGLAALSLIQVEGESIHGPVLALAAPLTLWVIFNSKAWRTNPGFMVFAISGLSLMVSALLIASMHEFEKMLTVIGGLLLALAHGYRWYRQQQTPADTPYPCGR